MNIKCSGYATQTVDVHLARPSSPSEGVGPQTIILYIPEY